MHHPDSPEGSRIKLILLALVDRQPGISSDALFSLGQDSLFFDYFSVAAAFADLQEKGLICSGERRNQNPGTSLSCQLSADGLAVLRRLEGSLPKSVRRTLDKLDQKQRSEEAASAAIEALSGGDWLLRLRAASQGDDLLRIELRLPSETLARTLAESWPNNAAKVYQLLLRTLSPEAGQNDSD